MTAEIASAANPRIKALAELKSRRGRDRAGRFLIEGARELTRALASDLPVDEIIFNAGLASGAAASLVEDPPAPVTTVGEAPFRKLSMRENPDGIIGVAPTWEPGLADIDHDLVLVAEAIEKPGNLGAMLRTADAAGAAVVVADAAVDAFNPNVVRASQGALFSVPLAVTDTRAATQWATERGAVIVTAPDAADTVWEADLTGPVTIVIGSEDTGVTAAWREVGNPVRIPMAGVSDSLNASVAAAIVLFEAVRQRSSRVAE